MKIVSQILYPNNFFIESGFFFPSYISIMILKFHKIQK